jgi:hypothetical protein
MSDRITRRRQRLAALQQRVPSSRGSRFARRLAGEPPVTFQDLAQLPDWVLLDDDAQEKVARVAGLIANRAAIDTELSGAKLAVLAADLGEHLFDAACTADAKPDYEVHAALPRPEQVIAQGWAMLHRSLPEGLGGGDDKARAVAAEAYRVTMGGTL